MKNVLKADIPDSTEIDLEALFRGRSASKPTNRKNPAPEFASAGAGDCFPGPRTIKDSYWFRITLVLVSGVALERAQPTR
jgi:hypothetical protein